ASAHLSDGASIVNISSIATHAPPGPGVSVFAAAKGAIEAFTRALAAELGPRRIRVNTVAPGMTKTDMLPDAFEAAAVSLTPFKRVGTVEDIAPVVAFLVSEKSRWVTGQIIIASGGIGFSY
ncbi:hypothetical protein HK405_004621, partial [Cladochytrium tenue]